jgi:hypothetical protein
MRRSRSLSVVLTGLCQWLLLVTPAFAHPASGIVVDDQGRIYFLFDSLYRIDPSGKLSVVQETRAGIGSRSMPRALSPMPHPKSTSGPPPTVRCRR